MSKIKRNDPCHCGSGKKYKKCCMNKSDEGIGSESLHEELKNHYSHFMAYVNRNYPNVTPTDNRETQEEEVEAAFRMVQGVFMDKQEDGSTLYDEFLEKKKDKIIRPATMATMEAWKSPHVSLFEIQETQTEQTVTVVDVWSGERYEVKRDGIPLKEENYGHMPYCIGVLLKWGPVYNFVPLAIPNYAKAYQVFREELESEFAKASDANVNQYMQRTLIEQLRKWMYMNGEEDQDVSAEQEDENSEGDEVLDLLDRELKAEPAFDQLKESWETYKQQEKPTFRKPEVVTAALEHIYRSTSYFRSEPEKVTKKAVAEKYDVSAGSMSKRITQINQFLDQKE
ncbi:YecA family protein [Halobacillus litoralis]|uniref:YecA family protein n=1 Tax=Halobacillus litoralis TaxID=45668 RepID=UPI001CFE0E24|nr:SEC-C domain-containing protein [Halobacillus litoralis]